MRWENLRLSGDGKAETPGRLRLHGSRSNTQQPGLSIGTLGSAGLAARATSRSVEDLRTGRTARGTFKPAPFGHGSVGLGARATRRGAVGDLRTGRTARGTFKPAPFGHGSVWRRGSVGVADSGADPRVRSRRPRRLTHNRAARPGGPARTGASAPLFVGQAS
jgi:hypothetical protein